MISSMTGYGCGESGEATRRYVVEARSENNRFLDISLRLPKTLAFFEQKIKNVVQEYIVRGRIYLTVAVENPSESDQNLVLNEELARTYYSILSDMKEKLDVPGEITIDVLAGFPNIVAFELPESDNEHEWQLIEPALHQAIKELTDMRGAEGARLQSDLENRIHLLESLISRIEQVASQGVSEAKDKLEKRLQSLIGTDQTDPLRLAMEAGIIAERCDVTEECVRFHSHNQLFRETLQSGGTVGKRLGFILQEMNREANTIGSKALNVEISHRIVQAKEEIEKLREQVQNIE